MGEKDFFDRFIRLLNRTKDLYNLDNLHDALILWYAENALFLDPEDTIERIITDKHGEGVDAVLFDEINSRLIFVQAKTVDNFDNTKKNLPENDIKKTLEGVRFLIRRDYKGKITPELENLVDEYHDKDRKGIYKTQILFLTLKQKPKEDKFIVSFKKEFENLEVKIIDFMGLKNFFENVYLTRLSEPPKKISLPIKTNILKKDEPYKSRIFTTKAEELARIYSEHKETIFQQNVRYFLGLKSKSINEQIYQTAIKDNTSPLFWYFNNGITMICRRIITPASEKVIYLEHPQIINGAQTTYALYRAYEEGNLKENAEVLLRVIETDDKDLTENITLYTNSQNAIRLRDLCSNDEIQIKIQKIWKGFKYFYERKRGGFDNKYPTKDEKKNALGDNYKERVISNEKSAQAFLAFYLDKPAHAKSEKKRIFIKDESGFYKDIFNESDGFLPEKLLFAWKLLKLIEEHKQPFKKKYKKLKEMTENEKEKIYKYDFILHSEYFILNLFKDFLKHKGYDIVNNKDKILEVINNLENNEKDTNTIMEKFYNQIIETLAEYIEKLRKEPNYYHNKFFKNEKSIALVREYFKEKYPFFEVISWKIITRRLTKLKTFSNLVK